MGKKQFKLQGKFNNLTVIKEIERYYSPQGIPSRRVLCRCDCGKLTEQIFTFVKMGRVVSCGCVGKKNRALSRTTHHKSTQLIYKIWASIKQRCLNPKNKSYKNYGGRGITICDSWLDFNNFYKDIGYKYKKGMSIERIDNEQGYYKENCKWIKIAKQQKNTRKNVFITHNDKTMTVSDLEKELGTKKDYIASYIRKGFTLNQILKRKKYEHTKI